MTRSVYEDRHFEVIAPTSPLNCAEDGGHLVLIKRVPVTDRSDLSFEEAIDFMRLSMAVGKAMYQTLNIERMNYEDLGNWGLDEPGGAKLHLHFFGRARKQVHQMRGQHMALFPKGHPIYDGHLKPIGDEDVARLKSAVADILREPKYVRMAELGQIARRLITPTLVVVTNVAAVNGRFTLIYQVIGQHDVVKIMAIQGCQRVASEASGNDDTVRQSRNFNRTRHRQQIR